jgi:hypothetical protein
MGEIVDLHNRQPTSYEAEFSAQLVQDLARFSEGLTTEKVIRRRYKFDDAVWESLADNSELLAAVEDEKTRRIRNGALKRERSQALVISAPGVLGEILLAKDANPRHRIDAAKALDDFSADKSETAAATDRFVITIVLDSDTTIKFDKSIKPDPNDVDPNHPDDTPMITAITAKKEDDGSGQEHI